MDKPKKIINDKGKTVLNYIKDFTERMNQYLFTIKKKCNRIVICKRIENTVICEVFTKRLTSSTSYNYYGNFN